MTIASHARLLLEHWGVTVTDIPVSSEEESDFLASFEGCRLLIEEKTKFDDPERLKERGRILSQGEVYGSSTPIVRNNRLSGIVSKAAKQLQSSAELQHDFRLIWF